MKSSILAITFLHLLSSVLGIAIDPAKSAAGKIALIDDAFAYSSIYNTTSSLSKNANGELPYPVVEPVFTGTVDGHAYRLSGPIDSIDEELVEMYPGINLTAVTPADGTHMSEVVASKAKRSGMAKDWPMQCFHRSDWETAHWWMAEFAEKRLMQDKTATFEVRPRSCSRMYCGLDTTDNDFGLELWTCNDRYDTINPNLAYLASYVMNTIWHHGCWKSVRYYGGYVTMGQFFDTDGYNVITKGKTNPDNKGVCRKLVEGIPFRPAHELGS